MTRLFFQHVCSRLFFLMHCSPSLARLCKPIVVKFVRAYTPGPLERFYFEAEEEEGKKTICYRNRGPSLGLIPASEGLLTAVHAVNL